MKKLFDHHIHLGYGNFKQENRSEKYSGTPLDNAYNNLLEFANSSVTTLRDGGDKKMLAYQLREEAKNMGITLYTAGRALVKKGCYGKRLGVPVGTMDELKKELDFLISKEVDCIKVIQSDIVAVNGKAQNEQPSFNEKELCYIREKATECNLPVMVHVNFPIPLKMTAEVGMDTIEHGYFIDDSILEIMAKNHVAWTPTLAPFANVLTYGTAIKGWDKDIVAEVVNNQKNMILRGADLGVKIQLGSDSGSSIVPHKRGTLDEFALLKELLGTSFDFESR